MAIAVFSVASIDIMPTGVTIAYIGDAEPETASDIQEFTKDLDQVIPLSPTGKVDALFLMGDMETQALLPGIILIQVQNQAHGT